MNDRIIMLPRNSTNLDRTARLLSFIVFIMLFMVGLVLAYLHYEIRKEIQQQEQQQEIQQQEQQQPHPNTCGAGGCYHNFYQ